MMEEQENIVTLVDENDQEVQFEHILTFEVDGKEYVVLAPLEAMEGIEEDEAIVLRIEQDEHGEDIYVTIDDEDEMQTVYEAYEEIVAEYDDEEDDDEEDDDEEDW